MQKGRFFDLTRDEVVASLDYCPDTGLFTRKNEKGARWKKGQIAGNVNKCSGYRLLNINGGIFLAHRVAWLCFYHQHPSGMIDHINGDRDDNRICNLREVSVSQNAQNKHKLRSDNTTGVTGVFLDKKSGNYTAYINVNNRRTCLGTFRCMDDAISARRQAESSLHPFSSPDARNV